MGEPASSVGPPIRSMLVKINSFRETFRRKEAVKEQENYCVKSKIDKPESKEQEKKKLVFLTQKSSNATTKVMQLISQLIQEKESEKCEKCVVNI